MRIDLEIATEIGALFVRHQVGNRFTTLLRRRSIEKLTHAAHVQLHPAVRALLVPRQWQQQIR